MESDDHSPLCQKGLDESVASSHLTLSVPAGLKLIFAKVAVDLPFPVPGGAGVAAEATAICMVRACV